jgi:Family of unknown function (DUF6521)
LIRSDRAARPQVELALLNPAFIGAVLLAAAADYRNTGGTSMPFELAFLVPPLVLHQETRELLPKSTTARLSGWVGGHPVVAAEFPSRAQSMVPIVREALRYVLAGGSARLEHGRLASPSRWARGDERFSGEAATVMKKAAFIGRWFATSGTSATLFGLLGVRT